MMTIPHVNYRPELYEYFIRYHWGKGAEVGLPWGTQHLIITQITRVEIEMPRNNNASKTKRIGGQEMRILPHHISFLYTFLSICHCDGPRVNTTAGKL